MPKSAVASTYAWPVGPRSKAKPASRAVVPGMGERVRYLRGLRGMGQRKLAELLGMDKAKVYRIESERAGVNGTTLRALALTLSTSSDFLLCLTNNPIPHRD